MKAQKCHSKIGRSSQTLIFGLVAFFEGHFDRLSPALSPSLIFRYGVHLIETLSYALDEKKGEGVSPASFLKIHQVNLQILTGTMKGGFRSPPESAGQQPQ